MKGIKSKKRYKELIKLTLLGLTILKWYSIATVSLLAGMLITGALRDKDAENTNMIIVLFILLPATLLLFQI